MKKFSEYIRTDEEGARNLFASPDARTFLRTFFELKKKLNPSYSYAVFAQKAGVAKSLPRDIVEGIKRITEKNFPNLLQAMELDGLMSEFLIHLHEDNVEMARKIADLYLEMHFKKSYTDQNFKNFKSPFLYAASGEVGKGVKLYDMAERTGIDPYIIKMTLPLMEELKLGTFDEASETFVPSIPQVHIESSDSGPSHFHQFYQYCLELQMNAVRNKFIHNDTFFYNEVFSVHKNDLPKMKAELRNTIKSFLIKAENPSGDSVAVLNMGLFRQSFDN